MQKTPPVPNAIRIAFSLILVAPLLVQFSAAETRLALVGGKIYVSPGEEPIRDGVILISEDKIQAVGPGHALKIPADARILDCSGLTVTAGFWNSHVHFMERKWAAAAETPAPELRDQLREMLTQYGFTSVFDTGSILQNTQALRRRIQSGEVPGPAIYSTGAILYPRGASKGSPPRLLDALGFMRVNFPEVLDAEEAAAASKQLLDAGSDGLKLYAATWFPPHVSLSQNTIAAAVEEAHRRGKPVFAHPTSRDGLMASIRAGVDVIVHTTPQSGPWGDALLKEMTSAGVALIPTLKLWNYELRHDRNSEREQFVEVAIGQLRSWQASRGAILFGTDVGYVSDYDPGDEYTLMARAGMGFPEILASLTTLPARQFGDPSTQGKIAPGYQADLVVLSQDPVENIRALKAVRYTFRKGKIIYSAVEDPKPINLAEPK